MQSAEDHAETASPCWEGNKSEGKGHQGNCSHPLFISASLFSLVTSPTQLSCVELAWNKAEPERGKSHPAWQDLAVSAMWKKSGVSDPRVWLIRAYHKGSSVGWREEKCVVVSMSPAEVSQRGRVAGAHCSSIRVHTWELQLGKPAAGKPMSMKEASLRLLQYSQTLKSRHSQAMPSFVPAALPAPAWEWAR